MEVNYKEKIAKRENIRSDFDSTKKTIEIYDKNKKVVDDIEEKIFTDEEYEDLFKPGGRLYPQRPGN